MSEKLKDFLARGGYSGRVFSGYFQQKIDPDVPRNGHRKERHPYEIRHLHSGRNNNVVLASMNILAYRNGRFYKIKSVEDQLSHHLEDKPYESPKEEPLPFNALGRLPEFKKLEILLEINL